VHETDIPISVSIFVLLPSEIVIFVDPERGKALLECSFIYIHVCVCESVRARLCVSVRYFLLEAVILKEKFSKNILGARRISAGIDVVLMCIIYKNV